LSFPSGAGNGGMALDITGPAHRIFAHTVLLTAVLWIMIKLQSLNYNFPGLLGSATSAAAGHDPVFRHAAGPCRRCICIWKMDPASMFPDAASPWSSPTRSVRLQCAGPDRAHRRSAADLHPAKADEFDEGHKQNVEARRQKPVRLSNQRKQLRQRARHRLPKISPSKASPVTRKSSATIQCGGKIISSCWSDPLMQTDVALPPFRLTEVGDSH